MEDLHSIKSICFIMNLLPHFHRRTEIIQEVNTLTHTLSLTHTHTHTPTHTTTHTHTHDHTHSVFFAVYLLLFSPEEKTHTPLNPHSPSNRLRIRDRLLD